MLFGGRTVQSLLYGDTVAHVSTKSSFTHLCWCRPGALIHMRHHLDNRADSQLAPRVRIYLFSLSEAKKSRWEMMTSSGSWCYFWELLLYLGQSPQPLLVRAD